MISDPHEAGKQGGHSSGSGNAGGDNYKPTENDGLTKDGNVDGRTKAGGNTEFAHGKGLFPVHLRSLILTLLTFS